MPSCPRCCSSVTGADRLGNRAASGEVVKLAWICCMVARRPLVGLASRSGRHAFWCWNRSIRGVYRPPSCCASAGKDYRAFARVAHGRHAHAFSAKLIAGDFATTVLSASAHGGRIYHVQDKPRYRAISEPDHRHQNAARPRRRRR